MHQKPAADSNCRPRAGIDRVVKDILSVRLGGDGFAFLWHSDARVLAQPVAEAILKPISERIPQLTREQIGKTTSDGKTFEARQADGDRYLYLSPIKCSDWMLGVSLPKSAANHQVRKLAIVLRKPPARALSVRAASAVC